jgi:hypothetical protein
MGEVMTMLEVVRSLDFLDEESTIYASEPWTENSKVVVAPEPEAGGVPLGAQEGDMKYFIEVFVARQFLEGWRENLDVEPTLQEKCVRLIQYAITDA